MNKYDFWDYIMLFIEERITDFEEDFTDVLSQRLRALFTSYCLMFNIKADSAECYVCLFEIFKKTEIDENFGDKTNETPENFDKFMLEFLE